MVNRVFEEQVRAVYLCACCVPESKYLAELMKNVRICQQAAVAVAVAVATATTTTTTATIT